MFISQRWQTMWLESQHCSKGIADIPLTSVQTQKILEDLRTNCCSPNKVVQLEALKCWEVWIKNQNPDDWKLNTVCFTAVRPLITKKLQPLQKDVDICKMRLKLMWTLLIKVQSVMQLEGPQYILEVFLQSCLTWLNSINEGEHKNEISILIFQLLLALFKKDENPNDWDEEHFPLLSIDILNSKKVFHPLADKFLSIFIHWKKVQDKSVVLKLWKYFLELCELSCEQIPIPVWHKIFKLASQICSEKNEPIKERLAFLHGCATSLKSVVSSSKFIDFGNLLTTPCEALLKKLVELCTVECNEFYDSEMFLHSKEICQVLSNKSVAIGGYDICLGVLDVLEEFWLRSLFWGVWCGLVYCYKIQLSNQDKNFFTKTQMKFYRKLRGVVINFELDKNNLHKDCITEVKKHIDLLNIACFCTSHSIIQMKSSEDFIKDKLQMEVKSVNENPKRLNPPSLSVNFANNISHQIFEETPGCFSGTYSTVALYRRPKNICFKIYPRITFVPRKTVNVNVDFISDILKSISVKCAKPVLNCLFSFRYFTLETTYCSLVNGPSNLSLQINVKLDDKEGNVISCFKRKTQPALHVSIPVKKNAIVSSSGRHRKMDDEVIPIRKTRSKVRAVEEKRMEMENQQRKKRKSFEVLVQEIVRKNKERKTEKNRKRKSPIRLKNKQIKKKTTTKTENEVANMKSENVSKRKLRNSKKEEPPKNQKKKGKKADGKLENYFKVISKKAGSEVKKEEKRPQRGKKGKKNTKESSCCNLVRDGGEKTGEIGWRQTSLKSMMSQKRKAEKVKRFRNVKSNVIDEKPKVKEIKRVKWSPLAKLGCFKEVLHDHEYAIIKFHDLRTYEKIWPSKKESIVEVSDTEKLNALKFQPVKLEKTEFWDTESVESQKKESFDLQEDNCITSEEKSELLERVNFKSSAHLEVEAKNVTTEEVDFQEKSEVVETETSVFLVKSEHSINVSGSEPKQEILSEFFDPGTANPRYVSLQENSEENGNVELTPDKRGKKRVRMLDSLKPSKKNKLDEKDFQDSLEVTEKENLKETQPEMNSPIKKEKIGASALKNDGSPKTVNGMISSRALRMIALVPESTKGSQMQWESQSRVEVLKCKKAPNVDKNSRASKMLALLSENFVEPEEVDEVKVEVEEVNSNKLASTPNAKTPTSSLKYPKSVRQRRSIRFDDAKNETVVYQTDTPPSQILEEKEKCRRIRPTEITVNSL